MILIFTVIFQEITDFRDSNKLEKRKELLVEPVLSAMPADLRLFQRLESRLVVQIYTQVCKVNREKRIN